MRHGVVGAIATYSYQVQGVRATATYSGQVWEFWPATDHNDYKYALA